MTNRLAMGTWVRVGDECPLKFTVSGGEVEFQVGEPRDGFELLFTEESLTRFTALAGEALRTRR